ncbi:MAG: hypothetical protein RhofKO_38610 [Rhodothermales bacterium]
MFTLYRRLYWPWLCLVFTSFAVVWSLMWLSVTEPRITLALLLDQMMQEVIYWNTWALAIPLVFGLVRRHSFSVRPFSWRWLLHVPYALLASMLVYGLSLLVFAGYYSVLEVSGTIVLQETLSERLSARLLHLVSFGLAFGTIVYALIAALALTWEHGRRLRDEQQQSAMLRAQLAEAELDVLKMQLQPHFLFNTLNTISATIQDDIDRADRMLAQLGDFLRLTLDNAHRAMLPLHEEIGFCHRYLQIEKHRLEDRLTVEVRLDPAVRSAEVPYLILQPLVENAIRHGVAGHRGPGRVDIDAQLRSGECLWIEVRNTAPAAALVAINEAARAPRAQGIGVANTRARLTQVYGQAAVFALCVEDQQVVARLRIPYRATSAARIQRVEDTHVVYA